MTMFEFDTHMGSFGKDRSPYGDMSTPYGDPEGKHMKLLERIRLIREAERMGQKEFADAIGMNVKTLRNYELGERESASSDQLELITNHPRFQKYTLWLMTGTTAPEAGQISPVIELERARQGLKPTRKGYAVAARTLKRWRT